MTNVEEGVKIVEAVEHLDLSIHNENIVALAVSTLCPYWTDALQSIGMKGELGAPDWRRYELKIWELGESLRLYLKKQKSWRGPSTLFDAIAQVMGTKVYGKGRQTFALLLGDFGGSSYSRDLGRAIEDPEVVGHAIKALTKLRAAGYELEVRKAMSIYSGWIRAAAKKYLSISSAV